MKPRRILFVCLGNICRSPMAACIFQYYTQQAGIENYYEIDSAGLDNYHEGENADSRMRAAAKAHGYNLNHLSRPITPYDFIYYDLILGMDSQNIKALKSRANSLDEQAKITRMTNYCKSLIEADTVPDPYYGGLHGFDQVITLLEDACQGLLFEEECKRKNSRSETAQ